MKKLTTTIILILASITFVSAQSNKIYVSRQGGEKKIFSFGKLTYSHYRFVSNCDNCDTLICSGAGYESCKIDRNVIKSSKTKAGTFKIYNKAIRTTSKYIKKTKLSSGDFAFRAKNKNVVVSFTNANTAGEADFEIQM